MKKNFIKYIAALAVAPMLLSSCSDAVSYTHLHWPDYSTRIWHFPEHRRVPIHLSCPNSQNSLRYSGDVYKRQGEGSIVGYGEQQVFTIGRRFGKTDGALLFACIP